LVFEQGFQQGFQHGFQQPTGCPLAAEFAGLTELVAGCWSFARVFAGILSGDLVGIGS
jgi:hypothetical protein